MQPEKELLQQKARQILLKLASVYTPSGSEASAKEIMKEISEDLSLNLKVTESNSYYLNEGSSFLLASHIDTVPGFIQPKEDDRYIWGRGVVDAKGPLTAMILASWYLKQEGIDVSVAALADEENKSRGARELLGSGKKFDIIIIGEPSNTTDIVVEYRGVAHLDINCNGIAEHASSSKDNIILQTNEKLRNVVQLPSSYDAPSIVPTILKCGEAYNVTPSSCYIHLDCRFSVLSNFNEILERIKATFQDCKVDLVEYVPPAKTQLNDLVKSLQRSLLTLGVKPRLVRKAGTSDMNILTAITREILAYGPGESKLEHTNFEKINLEEIYISVLAYVRTMEDLWKRLGKTS
ncbi:N-acetyl-lysine deacetylase [Sulfuracidifex metallicus]|uniref:[LysW]-lysine/[LysW]-ornithine hydrolase n=1 Tax=Sulfuracidifex metallicus DSM 6482 = JCM 9184 TaxID=523847 RepID=A0A6A9QSH7_SULME|nr:N-acetyl-lysine deacetylase [Sulfuracidifex metallicus]MUN28733.1 N-acetyl-lysine deacetylase [Sulfuracidifex metallicus DSM 6482 = JCM 9184]WOE50748.1 N-acetyl-lysine deacetylase [Sulfuracidifex metallicus DSM 6482 = JCM 9184]